MKRKEIAKKFAIYFSLVVIVALFLFPIYWMIITSLKSPKDILTLPPKLFWFKPTLANYMSVIFPKGFAGSQLTAQTSFPKFWLNSFIASIGATGLTMLIATPMAYSLARFNYWGKGFLGYFLLIVRMLPMIGILIPYYIMFARLGLTDNVGGLVIIYITLCISFFVWMMKSFFQEIPVDLEDAAQIDGCSRMGAVIRVVLPLSLPGLAACVILSFILCWSDFLYAYILTSSDARTATVGVYTFIRYREIVWGQLTAAGFVSSLPLLIMIFFVQKYLVRGLLMGGIKG